MRITYYPWNVQVLSEWLKQELVRRGSVPALALAIHVPPYVLSGWFRSRVPAINLQHIRGIARCRGWSVQQTLGWLELKPAHIEELIAQDPTCDRTSWAEAKATWFGTAGI